jgi:glycosyltransferase involved in cell wall biosynthesis
MINKSLKFPLISIITVVYNGAKTIEQTIQSVLNQSYENIEYIIIDGCSTDGTIDILKKYDNFINKWICEPDSGLYDAMNKGIAIATGELIGIINSDDWYEPDAVKIIVNSYLNNPNKLIFHGNRYDVDAIGNKRIYKFNNSKFKFFYFSMTYNHPSMFIHKCIYKSYNYNTNFKSISDYELVLKIFINNSDKFYFIPIAYVNYRLNGISANQNFITEIKDGFKARLNCGLKYHHGLLFIFLTFLRSVLRYVFKIKYISRYIDI